MVMLVIIVMVFVVVLYNSGFVVVGGDGVFFCVCEGGLSKLGRRRRRQRQELAKSFLRFHNVFATLPIVNLLKFLLLLEKLYCFRRVSLQKSDSHSFSK